MIVRVASAPADLRSWQLAGVLILLFGMTAGAGRSYRQALSAGDRAEAAAPTQLAAQLRVEKARPPRRRAARPRPPTAPRRSSSPPPATTCASRCTRWACSPRRCASAAHDPEVASLVNSINESVDALEGLFGELLDITRIDTGGVEVQPAHFEVGDMFAQLRLHFEPTRLREGPGAAASAAAQHVVHADPLLVERILRNLVSNAIRYTDDGGVLVGCRPARRAACCVQVWDSGIGIARGRACRASSTSSTRCRAAAPLSAAPAQGPGPGAGDRQAAGRPDGRAAGAALACPAAAPCSRSSCRSGKAPRARGAARRAGQGAARAHAATGGASSSSRTSRRCARA